MSDIKGAFWEGFFFFFSVISVCRGYGELSVGTDNHFVTLCVHRMEWGGKNLKDYLESYGSVQKYFVEVLLG